MHLVLSAKAGTDVAALTGVARAFLHDRFTDHRFMFGVHTDKEADGHIHAHAVITVRNEAGQKIHPGRGAFREWLEAYAEHAQAQGLKIVATGARERASSQSYGPRDKAIVEVADRPRPGREGRDRAYAAEPANRRLIDNARQRIGTARSNPVRLPVTEAGRRTTGESAAAWQAVVREQPGNAVAHSMLARVSMAAAIGGILHTVGRRVDHFTGRDESMAVTAAQMVKDLQLMNEAVSRTSDLLEGQTKRQFEEASARYLDTLADRIDLQRAEERGVAELTPVEVEAIVGVRATRLIAHAREVHPSFDPLTGTLAAFGAFAVGLFARPVGGLVFGHFGDRVGRKSMLLLSLFLMGIPTVLIGLLPTYGDIGISAAVLLVILRICQGLAVGGEWGGAVLMAVEHADDQERSLFGSLPQIGTPAGLICATLAFSFASSLPEESFLAWGWRVPFLISVVLIALGAFVRSKVSESPAFLETKASGHTVAVPSAEVISSHIRPLALAVGAKLAEVTLFYLVTVFVLQYTTVTLGLPRSEILNSILIAAAVGLLTIPLFGYLGDRYGLRLVYGLGALLLAAAAVPLFLVVGTRDPMLIRLAIVACLGGIYPMMYGVQPALYASQFPAGVRYSGISLGVQLAAAIGGGLAPIIAASLLSATGGTTAVGVYLSGLALLAAACCLGFRIPRR